MTEVKKAAKSTNAKTAWERPELRRMAAGSAEALFVVPTDGATQTS